uniref:Pilin n=1 Tax=uncultured Candidatus Melainabacteria bacterium TaxID=2682970 RepID=A0A650EJQ7_9BACT|nr:hypothetical protein Melaina855_2400 [uncultured Candidatus Melainabacteria bacterium]
MNKGFTLSEILITLGIVGIVAVLTVPGVMRNYQNRLYTAQLEKVYAQISDAAQAIMNDEHVDNYYETTAGGTMNAECPASGNCTTGLGYFLNNYFKSVKKNCNRGDDKCIYTENDKYKTISGENINGVTSANNHYCVQTVTGASICGFHNTNNNCTSILVDVNGLAQPNVTGRDVFAMDIHKNGSISDYNSGCADNSKGAPANTCTTTISTSSIFTTASGCLNSIIDAGWKMEY